MRADYVSTAVAATRDLEQFHVPAMSLGAYTIPAGGHDPRQPRADDEVYVLTGGRATLGRRRCDPGGEGLMAKTDGKRIQVTLRSATGTGTSYRSSKSRIDDREGLELHKCVRRLRRKVLVRETR
jgi:ribosomal protein L33